MWPIGTNNAEACATTRQAFYDCARCSIRWPFTATTNSGYSEDTILISLEAFRVVSIMGAWREWWFQAAPHHITQRGNRRHQPTGRPLGGQRFTDKLEVIVGRKLHSQKPGRPRTNGK